MSDEKKVDPTLVVIGKTGVGKSSFLNVLCGLDPDKGHFKVSDSLESCTTKVGVLQANWLGDESERIYVVDTPGTADTEGRDQQLMEEVVKFLRKLGDGVNAFVILFNGCSPRFDKHVQELLHMVEFMLTKDFWKWGVIAMTHCDPGAETIWKKKVDNWQGAELQKRLKSDFGVACEIPVIHTSIHDPKTYDKLKPHVQAKPFQCDSIRNVKEFFDQNPGASYQDAIAQVEGLQEIINSLNERIKDLQRQLDEASRPLCTLL